MKKTIIYGIWILILISSVIAEDAIINIGVTTDQNIDTIIIENADGNVINSIYCNGNTCTTNIENGEVVIPEGQTFNYNEYRTGDYTIHRRGLNIEDFIDNLAKNANSYNNRGLKFGENVWYDLWGLLDSMFVSHKEYAPTVDNVDYLAAEVDRLKAENELLMRYLEIEISPEQLECKTALNKALRTGIPVTTKSGLIADPTLFGEECIRIESD
jgi:hypothetical protein